MKKYAVVGYGRLGSCIAESLSVQKKDFVVFSRRKLKLPYRVCPFEDFEKEKIDIAFLCIGSAKDSLVLSPYFAKYSSTIDCYDNHTQIKEYVKIMDKTCQNFGTMAIIGAGWDPGVFSQIRAILSQFSAPVTFWGKGISLGHTNAVKSLVGVDNALCFTLPKTNKICQVGKTNLLSTDTHKRLCYVLAKPNADKNKLSAQIKTMPDYFSGYSVDVKFVSQRALDKISSSAHKGRIVSVSENCRADFSLSMPDNARLTADIMLSYSSVILSHFSIGAKTILDIPLSHFNVANLL